MWCVTCIDTWSFRITYVCFDVPRIWEGSVSRIKHGSSKLRNNGIGFSLIEFNMIWNRNLPVSIQLHSKLVQQKLVLPHRCCHVLGSSTIDELKNWLHQECFKFFFVRVTVTHILHYHDTVSTCFRVHSSGQWFTLADWRQQRWPSSAVFRGQGTMTYRITVLDLDPSSIEPLSLALVYDIIFCQLLMVSSIDT